MPKTATRGVFDTYPKFRKLIALIGELDTESSEFLRVRKDAFFELKDKFEQAFGNLPEEGKKALKPILDRLIKKREFDVGFSLHRVGILTSDLKLAKDILRSVSGGKGELIDDLEMMLINLNEILTLVVGPSRVAQMAKTMPRRTKC